MPEAAKPATALATVKVLEELFAQVWFPAIARLTAELTPDVSPIVTAPAPALIVMLPEFQIIR